MIQGFCFGIIFMLSIADVIYKIKYYEQLDSNNAICVLASAIGVLHAIW